MKAHEGGNAVSGKKRITVDEDAWRAALKKADQLRAMQRELPGLLESVRKAHEQQAARDRAALQATQDELASKLTALSARAREIEESTSRRITADTASIMNETRKANADLRAETRQLIERQEQRFDAAMADERAARKRDVQSLRREIDKDRAAKADILAAARTAVADARLLFDSIDSTLPHERYAPGQLQALARNLELAEGNVAAGTGETALGQAQDLFLRLGDLRAEVQLRDAEWRAAHLDAVTVVTALIEQLTANERVDVTNEESGVSGELDVDFWSGGELTKIRKAADELAARLADDYRPVPIADLQEISERTVASLDTAMSEAIALAHARQLASQVRVNVAEHVVNALEQRTGFFLDENPVFAESDQRQALYSRLRNAADDEIVVEVAPDETGRSCTIRILSYESGTPNEYLRGARARTVSQVLGDNGLPGKAAPEPGEPDPVYRDLARLGQRPAGGARAVPGRA